MKLLDLFSRISSTHAASGTADQPTRRDLLTPGTALAALLAAPRAQASRPRGGGPNLRLIEHMTFGLTEAEIARLNTLGDHDYIEYQIEYQNIDDSALDQRISNYLALPLQPFQLTSLTQNQVTSELAEATILRSVFSERQLYQRMVEFWTDHFNMDINKDIVAWLKVVDDREVVRAHAMGNFRDLLYASAYSPSMMFYLDNAVSGVGNPNENYARELMELHTLGVDGGYTQQDVVEVARCFTGWGLYSMNQGINSWSFRWNLVQHDAGQKTVLGNVIPPGGGLSDGETVLDILAAHPSTAQFLAKKLTKYFWGYNPPQGLIDAVAAAYIQSDGDIKSMLRALFHSPEAANMPLKFKRPYHLFISALRATGGAITTTTAMRQAHLAAAGQVPFTWDPPDGFPDSLDYWAGLILPRWNFGASLLNGNITGLSVDINAFLAGANTAQAVVDRIDTALFGGVMPQAEKDRIRDYLLPDAPTTARMRDAVGLAIDSPAFQWF